MIVLKLLLSCLFFAPASFAMADGDPSSAGSYRRLTERHSDHGSSAPLFQIEESRALDAESVEAMAARMADSIHEIQHHHGAKLTARQKIKEWLQQFRLIDSGRQMRRWMDMQSVQNPALQEHILNLGVLFAASHPIEMLLGPAISGIGFANDWPAELNWLILGTGMIISIPGIDPICIILAATYKASPRFRTALTQVRLWSTRLAARSLRSVVRMQSGHERLATITEAVDANTFVYALPGATIRFHRQDDKTWLDVVEINDMTLFEQSWPQHRLLFDGNVRSAIEAGRAENPQFFIRDTARPAPTTDGNAAPWLRVRYQPGAIRPRGCLRILE